MSRRSFRSEARPRDTPSMLANPNLFHWPWTVNVTNQKMILRALEKRSCEIIFLVSFLYRLAIVTLKSFLASSEIRFVEFSMLSSLYERVSVAYLLSFNHSRNVGESEYSTQKFG